MESDLEYTKKVFGVIKHYIVEEGHSPELTRQYLMNHGYIDSPNDADELIDLCDQAKRAKSSAKKDLIFGLLWFIGGLVVTIATYSAASTRGGRYFITWGAIVFGFIQFIKGLVSLIRANNRLNNPF